MDKKLNLKSHKETPEEALIRLLQEQGAVFVEVETEEDGAGNSQ